MNIDDRANGDFQSLVRHVLDVSGTFGVDIGLENEAVSLRPLGWPQK